MGMVNKVLDTAIGFGMKAKNFLGDVAGNASKELDELSETLAKSADDIDITSRRTTKAQWKAHNQQQRINKNYPQYKAAEKAYINDAYDRNKKFDLNKSFEQVSGIGGRELNGLDVGTRIDNLRAKKINQGDATKKSYKDFVKRTQQTYSIPEAEIKATIAGKPYNESLYDVSPKSKDLRNADNVKKSGMANLMWNHKGATAAVGIGAAWGVSELTEE